MLVKHFGADLRYLEYEIPWDHFTIRLAIALDLEERERFRDWWTAGQDPKKFPWSSPDHAGLGDDSARGFWDKVKKTFKGKGSKGDIGHVAPVWGERRVRKVEKRYADGRVETSYVDAETGEPFDMSGRVFLKTKVGVDEGQSE